MKSSYSYRYKYKFYSTLEIDFETRQLIRDYNYVKDQTLNDKIVYFVKKENNNER